MMDGVNSISSNALCNADYDHLCLYPDMSIYKRNRRGVCGHPPAAVGSCKIDDLKTGEIGLGRIIWHMDGASPSHISCNTSRIPLDDAGGNVDSSEKVMSDDDWLDLFLSIRQKCDSGTIVMSGFEPLRQDKLIMNVIDALQPSYNFIINTSLRCSVLDMSRCCRPDHVYLMVDINPSDRSFNFESFLGRCLLLNKSGFQMHVNMIPSPDTMYLFDRYDEVFSDHGINIAMTTYVREEELRGDAVRSDYEYEYVQQRTLIKPDYDLFSIPLEFGKIRNHRERCMEFDKRVFIRDIDYKQPLSVFDARKGRKSFRDYKGMSSVMQVHPVDVSTPATIDFSSVTVGVQGRLKINFRNYDDHDCIALVRAGYKVIAQEVAEGNIWREFDVPFDHQDVCLEVHAGGDDGLWNFEFLYFNYEFELPEDS